MAKKHGEIISADGVLQVECKCPYCYETNYFETWSDITNDEELCLICGKTFLWDINRKQ